MKPVLHLGDCLEVMRGMPDGSVDSVVCDPPYGLSDHSLADTMACLQAWLAGEEYRPKKRGFMGRSWDAWVPGPEVWREVLRVLKPGGHLLAFAGTRSMDLMSMAVRLAGFELRDAVGYASDGGDPTQAPVMAWAYAQGFPKSMDVSKAIDKAAGAEREVVGERPWLNAKMDAGNGVSGLRQVGGHAGEYASARVAVPITAPATDAARQWQGFGTALKPAWEPIILARKPLIGTVAENVLAHGTGALNIDMCRVGGGERPLVTSDRRLGNNTYGVGLGGSKCEGTTSAGRWPANLIHDGSEEVLAAFPDAKGQQGVSSDAQRTRANCYGATSDTGKQYQPRIESDKSAARFFYCAKASKRDRGEGNKHPTVKPPDLMRYLCRLVTPPGGIVLDPFMGSGSTGKAAGLEGFRFIGIEQDPTYFLIAAGRIQGATP